MRIAVTYNQGCVFQHFGHTEQFKIYETKDTEIISSVVVDTNGQGHGALAGFLAGQHVDAVLCGGIGPGAQMALAEAGIKVYGSISGNADSAVRSFINGQLGYESHAGCSGHAHDGADHHCGANGCGKHDCEKNGCHQ